MSKRYDVMIQSSVMDRARKLIIDPDYLQFDDQDRIDVEPSRFNKEDIVGIRYGARPIRGYMFNIGRIYCIDVRHESGKTISIRLKTIYRIRKKTLEEKFADIIKALFENYYRDLVNHYINLFNNQFPFELLGVGFRSEGLVFKPGEPIVPWEDLGTRDYWRYFALFCKSDRFRYRTFEYLEDWNTGILYAVSRYILQAKNVWKQ